MMFWLAVIAMLAFIVWAEWPKLKDIYEMALMKLTLRKL